MKISADIVGREARAETVQLDKRWIMPNTLSVHAFADGTSSAFETRNEKDEPVIERGWIS